MINDRRTINATGQVGSHYVDRNRENDHADLLNDLIETNRGIINVYETASERMENVSNAKLLRDYAAQHKSFVSTLSNIVAGEGKDPETSGTGSSLVKQAWVTLKAAVTEGDGPILSEVAKDAETALEAYVEVMGVNLIDDTREIVRKQMSEVRIAHKKLSALSAAYNQ